jgi:hypothetical protein
VSPLASCARSRVGYRVTKWQITATDDDNNETWRAVAWELLEASLVPVPADPNAVVRSAPGTPEHGNQEEDDMRRNLPGGAAAAAPASTTTASAATPAVDPARADPAVSATPAVTPVVEPARSAPVAVSATAILTAARNAGLDQAVQDELIARHDETPFTRDALLADIGRRFAERDTPVRTASTVPASAGAGTVPMARAIEDAIVHRMAPRSELSEAGRAFRGMSLLRMAEEVLTAGGVNCRGMAPNEIAERALHTTSDFPALMGSGLNRRLRAAYEENNPTYRMWARRAPNAPDFRSIDVVQISAMPDLLKVNEAGEFKYGTASDGKVSYKVLTYGRIIGISRQTIVNDDLRALERMTTGFAGAAARLENRTAYGILTANAAMPDSVALFHATHANLAGAGAAISATTLGAGRTAMRLQKGLQSEELNLAPKYLIVPATQEQLAYQYTSSQYVPAKQSDTNEFRAGGRTAVEPIVESVLDGSSTTSWYMAADTAQCDTVEYCYLEGAEGVQMSSRIGFTVDGVELKASLDFAAAAIDYRGLYKNPGA